VGCGREFAIIATNRNVHQCMLVSSRAVAGPVVRALLKSKCGVLKYHHVSQMTVHFYGAAGQ
jgi:hypothetical protein